MAKQERITVKLADLQEPERNVRMHPERQIKEIMRSLDRFGQCRDIVVDENNVVLAGNGLVKAMELRGDATASAILLSGLSDNEKIKFMLADNKTFSLGIDDLDGINEVLEKLGADLDVPGYDEDTLKALVATAEDVTERIMSYGTVDEETIQNIKEQEAQRQARHDNNVVSDSNTSGNLDNDLVETENENASSDNDDAVDVNKSIICPKCGERIWL